MQSRRHAAFLVLVAAAALRSTCACEDLTQPGGEKWYTTLGEAYDCSYLGHVPSTTRCEQFGGDEFRNFGLTGREACCFCGGGTAGHSPPDPPTPPPTREPPVPTPAPPTATPPTPSPPTAVPPTPGPPTPSPLTPAPLTPAPKTASPPTLAPPTRVPETPEPPIEATPFPATPVPPTPAPKTPSPLTAAPPTPAPETAVPPTQSPGTPEPPTPSPLTASPPTPVPATSAPVTPEPPAPATLAPLTPAPRTPSPPTPSPPTAAPQTPGPPTPSPPTPHPPTPAPAPPTRAPLTRAPETASPQTFAPPTRVPKTPVPPTPSPDTQEPPTPSPPTPRPPTPAPPTFSPSTPAPTPARQTPQPPAATPQPARMVQPTVAAVPTPGPTSATPEPTSLLTPEPTVGRGHTRAPDSASVATAIPAPTTATPQLASRPGTHMPRTVAASQPTSEGSTSSVTSTGILPVPTPAQPGGSLLAQGGDVQLLAQSIDAAAVGALVGGGAATLPGKLALVKHFGCDVEDVDLEGHSELDREIYPVGTPFGSGDNRYLLGAAVLNPVLLAAFALAAQGLAVALRLWSPLGARAAAYTRCPGVSFVPYLFLLAGTSLVGAQLLASTGAPGERVLGAAVLAACLAAPCLIHSKVVRAVTSHAKVVDDPRVRGSPADGVPRLRGWRASLYTFAFGDRVWVTEGDGFFCEAYGVVFEAMKPRRVWFVTFEQANVLCLSLLSVWKPGTPTECDLRNSLATLVCGTLFVAIAAARPYLSVLQTLFAGVIAAALFAALLFMTIAISLGGHTGWLMTAALWLLIVTGYIAMVKCVCDLAAYVYDLATGRQWAVRDEARKDAAETLLLNVEECIDECKALVWRATPPEPEASPTASFTTTPPPLPRGESLGAVHASSSFANDDDVDDFPREASAELPIRPRDMRAVPLRRWGAGSPQCPPSCPDSPSASWATAPGGSGVFASRRARAPLGSLRAVPTASASFADDASDPRPLSPLASLRARRVLKRHDVPQSPSGSWSANPQLPRAESGATLDESAVSRRRSEAAASLDPSQDLHDATGAFDVDLFLRPSPPCNSQSKWINSGSADGSLHQLPCATGRGAATRRGSAPWAAAPDASSPGPSSPRRRGSRGIAIIQGQARRASCFNV